MALHPRSSEAAAAVSASRLLNKANVQTEIRRLTTEALKKAQASADQVLAELSHLGFSDIGNAVWKPGELDSTGNPTRTGTIKPLHEMPAEVRRSIKSIRIDSAGNPEITMWADKPALTNLARHHKLIGADVNVNIQTSFAERLKVAREKRLRGLRAGTKENV